MLRDERSPDRRNVWTRTQFGHRQLQRQNHTVQYGTEPLETVQYDIRIPFDNFYKPGGTFMITAGDLAARIVHKGKDKWGRWVTQTIAAKIRNEFGATVASGMGPARGGGSVTSYRSEAYGMLSILRFLIGIAAPVAGNCCN